MFGRRAPTGMLWKIIKRAFKLGEHIDFGGKLVDIIVDWRALAVMALGSLVASIVAYIENRPCSEIIIIGLAAPVLLLAFLWGAVQFFEWWKARLRAALAPASAPSANPSEIGTFSLALNVHKMWVQMPHLNDLLIHINVDFFNGNGEGIYFKGINGHIVVRSKGQNDAQLKPLGNLITPSFSETRRTHIPAGEPFSFTLTQTVPKKFAEALSNWNKDVEYVLDFEALNVVVQSTDDPDRAARLPLWEAGSLKRRNGEIIMIQIINLRPGARGLAQFGLIKTPSPRKEP